jgi:hypothetical protein
MEGSKFREILTDHVDENGAVHIDGYKTVDPNESGVTIGVVINGYSYFRDPEDQFDPYVIETLAAIKEEQQKERKELEVKITKAVTGVYYTPDAKPRPEFRGTDVSLKVSLINEGVENILRLL